MNSYEPLLRNFIRLLLAALIGLMLGWISGVPFRPSWPLEPYVNNVWARLATFALCLIVFEGSKRIFKALRRRIPLWQMKERSQDLDFPSWVELRRIGESNAVKLTALAPILGSLILMNDEVAHLLQSSLLDLKIDQSKQLMLGIIPIPRLHMIYLGLSLLGIGAICFALLCPDVIKRYPSAEAWLEGEDRFLTGAHLRREFFALIQNYWNNTTAPPPDPGEHEDSESRPWYADHLESRNRRKGYSYDHYWQVHVFIDELVETDDPTNGVWEPPAEEPSSILAPDGRPAVREQEIIYDTEAEREEYWRRFRAGPRGHVNTDAWIAAIAHAYPYERGLWDTLAHSAAEKFKERIVHIRFHDFAYQQRFARGTITAIYGLGLIALAIPTLHTFGAIILSAFNQMAANGN